MLRDLAIRTRSFKLFFEAWETLHIIPSPVNITIQQNVIERVRQRPSIDTSRALQNYDKMRCFMNRFAQHLFPWTMGYFADHMLLHAGFHGEGRGIVITVGDHQVSYVLTSIRTFRELGCGLPVEVFFLGDNDLHEDSRSALAKIPGVATRDLSQMIHDDGWTLKGR
jgi:alpha 1,3-mannosyltransferase